MKRRTQKQLGRPKGAASIRDRGKVVLSRCPRCGSTRRTGYAGTVVQLVAGVMGNGIPFNRIVLRRTTCVDCGLPRRDEGMEYIPPQAG